MSFHVGDTAPDLTGQLTTDGSPKDITGAALAVHVERPDGTMISRAGTITDAAAGEWSMAWQVADLTVAGGHRVEVQVTYASGKVQTFGAQWFTVEPELA